MVARDLINISCAMYLSQFCLMLRRVTDEGFSSTLRSILGCEHTRPKTEMCLRMCIQTQSVFLEKQITARNYNPNISEIWAILPWHMNNNNIGSSMSISVGLSTQHGKLTKPTEVLSQFPTRWHFNVGTLTLAL